MRVADDEEWFFFDDAERALLRQALAAIGQREPKQRELLEASLDRLRRLALLIRESPSIAASWDGGTFSADSLVDQLCRVPDYDLDLHVPTKAVLGQAFLVAKINLLKAFGYKLAWAGASQTLCRQVEQEVAQSIYTKLAEELFISLVTDETSLPRVKHGAAKFLFEIWEERLLIEVDDFAPLLESAWDARSKLLPVLGTMLGTHEVFRLFKEARDKRFLDYFGEDDVEEEQLLAFEEFLFGLSHEEITRIRAHMAEQQKACITLDGARAILGTSGKTWVPRGNAAQALYTSYKKRRVKAAYRVLTDSPGPKKTAEAYVLTAFLQTGVTPSIMAMKAVRPTAP